MDSTDSTTTPTRFDNTNTITLAYDTVYKGDCDYDSDYIKEEREWVRTGWCNPRKITIPRKHIYRNINIQIRNQLPYKIREITNGLYDRK